MGAHESNSNTDTRLSNDTGIDIRPGVVCVNLAIADVGAMTVTDLRDAMDEALAQELESNLDAEELLGDFNINPL